MCYYHLNLLCNFVHIVYYLVVILVLVKYGTPYLYLVFPYKFVHSAQVQLAPWHLPGWAEYKILNYIAIKIKSTDLQSSTLMGIPSWELLACNE